MADVKLVVFDVDGTLIDSLAHIKGAMSQAFEAMGEPVPEEHEIRAIIGLSLPVAMDRLRPGLGDAELHELVEGYKASFAHTRMNSPVEETAPLFPGARAALERLSARDDILLGVATGKSRRGLDKMTEAHGLGHYFVTTQVADDHPSKPHPSMLEATLRETGAEAARAVMIGDTSFDLEMGRSAGFGTVGVNWGYHAPDALGAIAHHMIDDFKALDVALERLWES
ncbi:MAG: HAD-IA family hydrolase [Litoreibacter sp.]|nr:HAD-IA family hydrolase [Litoreibacter sp.]